MTETVPKGSGQLDPETAAKLTLQTLNAKTACNWGAMQSGERLKDYALQQVEAALSNIGAILRGDSEGDR